MNLNNALKADLTLVLVTLIAGAGWIFSKESVAGMAPLAFVFMRFTGAGVILALFGRRQLARLDRDGWRRSLLSGLCFGIFMVFWILGLQYSQHLGVGAFLNSLGLVLVPLASMLLGSRPERGVWLPLLIALTGLGCLSLDGQFRFGWGELSFLIAALIFSFTFVITSRASAITPALALTSIQLVLTGLIAVPLMLLINGDFDWPASASVWGWVLASVLIATCLRFFLQIWGQGQTSPSAAAVILLLEPVWAALMSAAWYGEQSSGWQITGCVLIFAALLASRRHALLALLRKIRPLAA